MSHVCHWPGCTTAVPPKLFACRPHWFSLPVSIRRAILAAYEPGQERRKDPSDAYIAAAMKARHWALAQGETKETHD